MGNCTSCDATKHRILGYRTCVCEDKYYNDYWGTKTCIPCIASWFSIEFYFNAN